MNSQKGNMEEKAHYCPDRSKSLKTGLKCLVVWNLLCLVVPTILFLQPSPEPAIANAVVMVVFVTPALWLAFFANGVYWLKYRKALRKGIAFYLTLFTGIAALIWTVIVFTQ